MLAQSGPCGLRNDRIPFVGVVTLDLDDLTPLSGSRTLTDVIFHELGHVLGFGTLWNSTLLTGGNAIQTDAGGFFIEPTVFGDVDPQSRIAQEEIFAPVLAVIMLATVWTVIVACVVLEHKGRRYDSYRSVFGTDPEHPYNKARRDL